MTEAQPCGRCIYRRELVDGEGFDLDRCVRYPPVFCSVPIYGMKVGTTSRVAGKKPDIIDMLDAALKPPDQSMGWTFPPALQRCGEYREEKP